jgi:orotidine-5'-phosphate decarboxylase
LDYSREAPKVIVALDYAGIDDALHFVDCVSPEHCSLKVGKELFAATGSQLVRELVRRQFRVFLDLKFHDIPTTVAQAVARAADLGVWMVNIHASGGSRMMEAAVRSLDSYGKDRPLLTAVTVLTSLAESDLKALGIIRSLSQQVAALSKMAHDAGVDGVVCSAQEAPMLRQQQGSGFVLVTPGIRLLSASLAPVKNDDQSRVATPRDAIRNGADYLVIGRPITQSDDPLQTLLTIKEDISYTG